MTLEENSKQLIPGSSLSHQSHAEPSSAVLILQVAYRLLYLKHVSKSKMQCINEFPIGNYHIG